MERAVSLLDEMSNSGILPPVRVESARSVLYFLSLWKAPPPTDLADGTDGDFSMIWRNGSAAASLYFNADEVLGYSFKPGMAKPWVFEGERISVADLNTFVRTLG